MAPKSVLVTGANGFVGEAVCHAFSTAGWRTYGLVRSADKSPQLAANEIIPLIGSPSDMSFLEQEPVRSVRFNAIVSTTEDPFNYEAHFNEIIVLVAAASKAANAAGEKPLLLFTTGAKDTGASGPLPNGFSWHDEKTPYNAPPYMTARVQCIERVFKHAETFHAVLVRPTLIYGRSGSWYGPLLHQGASSTTMTLYGCKDTVWHGVHVDDVARAYLLLAAELGAKAHGQLYNVSNDNYETLGDIATAISKAYGGNHEIVFMPVQPGKIYQEIMGFSQAIRGDKLKRDTSWRQRKEGFIEGVGVYKAAYEELKKSGDQRIARMLGYAALADKSVEELPFL